MKTTKIATLIILALTIFTSCAEDPLAYIFDEGSEWNNERGVKGIMLTGQIGQAEIINTVDESLVKISINPEAIDDWSKVTVTYLGLSWGASANIEEGSTLDLDNPEKTATIMVTSETGLSKEWTITAEEFINPVSGSWLIQEYKYSYDDYYGWGNSGSDVDLYLKLPTSTSGLDDHIDFGSIEGVSNGMPFGEYSRTPGDDGEFASYILDDIHDFSPMFGQLPEGNGTYFISQDGDGETIIIIETEAGNSYTTSVISITGNNKINIKLLPIMRDLSLIDWDNYYASYTSFVSCIDIYYKLIKQ